MANANDGQVAISGGFHTLLVGDLAAETYDVPYAGGQRMADPMGDRVILPAAAGGEPPEFVHQIPDMGRFMTGTARPLAAYEDANAVGLVPGQLLAEQTALSMPTLAEIGPYSENRVADLSQDAG